MSKDIECPYCGYEQDICNDDGHGTEQGIKYREQCYKCEKYFVFTSEIVLDYYPQKADCLNTGIHNYKMTKTYPTYMRCMRCVDCDEEREFTNQERIDFNIPKVNQYEKDSSNMQVEDMEFGQ